MILYHAIWNIKPVLNIKLTFPILFTQVIDLQHKLGVHISGAVPPRPVTSFGHFGFDDTLLKAIRRSDFTQPTPIQVSQKLQYE